MNEEFFFESISRNVVIFFWIAVLACHLLVIIVFKLKSVGLKALDYAWLFLGLMGIIPLTQKSINIVADNEYHLQRSRTDFQLEHLKRMTQGDLEILRTYYTITSNNIALSQETHEYRLACDEIASLMETIQNNATAINKDLFDRVANFGKGTKYSPTTTIYSEMSQNILRYMQYKSDLQRIEKAMQPRSIDKFFAYISPYLLALSIALRLSKTTGELLLARAERAK